MLTVPLALEDWEVVVPGGDVPARTRPSSLRPTYLRSSRSSCRRTPHELTTDVDEAQSLRGLAATWIDESNGHADAVAVNGSALQAVAALGLSRARVVVLTPGQAFGVMAWTGCQRRRQGTAAGHGLGPLLAWECASILLRVDIEDVGAHVDELAWFAWDAFEPQTGWSLRLAVEDPANGCAWAVAATDQSETGPSTRSR